MAPPPWQPILNLAPSTSNYIRRTWHSNIFFHLLLSKVNCIHSIFELYSLVVFNHTVKTKLSTLRFQEFFFLQLRATSAVFLWGQGWNWLHCNAMLPFQSQNCLPKLFLISFSFTSHKLHHRSILCMISTIFFLHLKVFPIHISTNLKST